jgi:Repeat of unknown function (DUF5650)/Secretion system C-terminal sorting domain
MNKKIYILAMLVICRATLSAQTTTISGPPDSWSFGKVTVLANGNYVVTDPDWDNGATSSAGAVYLYNGFTKALISTLTGSNANDQVGSGGITLLTNGNYVVSSNNWQNGANAGTGAITWCNGSTGLNGIVSITNSLVGTNSNDHVGSGGVIALSNNNYLVTSLNWKNGANANAGAITWCKADGSTVGAVSTFNSLVGTNLNDQIGSAGIVVLLNNNYVVRFPTWKNGANANAGAVTWCKADGTTVGIVAATNSLVGTNASDQVGIGGIIVLSNNNYVVSSNNWKNGANGNAGAVTLCKADGTTLGAVSTTNSLVGTNINDRVGAGVIALSNNNYVVRSYNWKNGANVNAGAVTWCKADGTTVGAVSSTNSLVGSNAADQVGNGGVSAISTNNYIVNSNIWRNGGNTSAGAVTWCKADGTTIGAVSATNSLVGTNLNDQVGSGGVFILPNDNYVVSSFNWKNGANANAGAVTRCKGDGTTVGAVTTVNSLVGTNASDQVGYLGIIALSNNNYVVKSWNWKNGTNANAGAVTWCKADGSTVGAVSALNSLTGSNANDYVGGVVYPLTNNNYVVNNSTWKNGGNAGSGAVTWCKADGTTVGTVSATNSLVGTKASDYVGGGGIIVLSNNNYVVSSPDWANGANDNAGAVTWCKADGTTIGPISANNSLIGTDANMQVGSAGAKTFSNGNYGTTIAYNNGFSITQGSFSFGNANTGLTGTINSCNSIVFNPFIGISTGYSYYYNGVYDYYIVGRPDENEISIFKPDSIILANTNTVVSTNIVSTPVNVLFKDETNCMLVAKVTGAGSNAINGATTAKVWIENIQPATPGFQYVKRHYEITPATNAANATGKVTLYFTQAEFDDFNAISTIQLPTDGNDAAGKANLLIEKRPGSSIDGSGLPGTYTGIPININPADADIIWNVSASRWEVSFDVTGFSGFFLKTQTAIIPLKWLKVSGSLNNWQQATISWEVRENEVANYEVEKSIDGRNFGIIGTLHSKGDGTNIYTFIDLNSLQDIAFYRIRQVDRNNRFSYSSIIKLSITNFPSSISVYPNPAKDIIIISGSVAGSKALLTDVSGKILQELTITHTSFTADLHRYVSGLYLLKFANGVTLKILKK